jgi:cellulose synthase (UDP-forming)
LELRPSRWLLGGLIALGLAALVFYFHWWLSYVGIALPWLAVLLSIVAVYNWSQLLLAWVLYWKATRRPDVQGLLPGVTVDLFLPIYNEPFPVVERALRAAMKVRGANAVWVLDDGQDEAAERLARDLGARYRRRTVRTNAKAGNVNAALAESTADLIAIFDIDHAPLPEFLERSVPHFADPRVGFVQVMLSFANESESWIARASTESALDFYNPTSLGMDAVGSATLVGSNAVIRRKALDDLGGYRPGLAEDLATSVALHAAGWRSAYVAEPLAPGLAPADLAAWFSQQLKWSRGVFEVVVSDFPRLFPRLTAGQRLAYTVRGTYYLIGLMVGVHILFTLLYLNGGERVAHIDFTAYLEHILPLMIIALLIRQVAMRTLRHPSVAVRVLWRPMVLVMATWPVYLLGLVLTLLRVPIDYRPTPKAKGRNLSLLWLIPQASAAAALLYLIATHLTSPPILLLFAAFQVVSQVSVLVLGIGERVGKLPPMSGSVVESPLPLPE